MTIALSRRAFIQASLSAAGGLAIAAFAPEIAGATTIAGGPWSPESGKGPNEVNAFVVIDPDNSITLRVAKSDMGQGAQGYRWRRTRPVPHSISPRPPR